MRLLIAAGFSLAALAALPFVAFEGAAEEEAAATAEYVGSDACKKCHFKQHRYWKKTHKVDTLAALRPTTEADDKARFDKKTKAKLDPKKDYSTDKACLPCHTTGMGKKGGYPEDGKADEDMMKSMGQIGCESCHGAGSLYVKHKTDALEKDKEAKFTFEDMEPLGLVQPDEKVCTACHNEKAGTQPAEPFDFETAKKKVHSKKKKKKKK